MLPALIPILAPIFGDLIKTGIERALPDPAAKAKAQAEVEAAVAARDVAKLEALGRQLGLQVELQRVLGDIEQAYLADRQSARQLTADLARAGFAGAWSAPVLSAIVLLGFFACVLVVLSDEIPPGGREIAFMLLGALAAGFQQVTSYWLGSSRGSAEKNALLARPGADPSRP